MQVIRDAIGLRAYRAANARLAFVPTMGYLHAGHAALVALAREQAARAIASIYVNPLQFGPNEDFSRYPRSFDRDVALLEAAGADAVFVPDDAPLNISRQQVFVEPSALAQDLCGAFRPGHFRGVATIVLKLLHLVAPDLLVLGRKDLQQLVIVREMLGQLNLAVELIAAATVRDADGLALSSRNQYLSAVERAEAPRLYRCLRSVAAAAQVQGAAQMARQELEGAGWKVDYIAVRDAYSLAEPSAGKPAVVLGAGWLGSTRLIDNVEFSFSSG